LFPKDGQKKSCSPFLLSFLLFPTRSNEVRRVRFTFPSHPPGFFVMLSDFPFPPPLSPQPCGNEHISVVLTFFFDALQLENRKTRCSYNLFFLPFFPPPPQWAYRIRNLEETTEDGRLPPLPLLLAEEMGRVGEAARTSSLFFKVSLSISRGKSKQGYRKTLISPPPSFLLTQGLRERQEDVPSFPLSSSRK